MIIKINHVPLTDIAKSLFSPEEVQYTVKEWAKEKTQEFVLGAIDGLWNIVVESIDGITLIGGGLCILLWVAGWHEAKKWFGVLVLTDVLIKYLVGGG